MQALRAVLPLNLHSSVVSASVMLNHPHGLAAPLCSLPYTKRVQVSNFVNVEWHTDSSSSMDGEYTLTLSVDNVSGCTSNAVTCT